jgi:hypothetical protein
MVIWNIIQPFWYILWPFRSFVTIWYIFHCLGYLNEEKSGIPASDLFSTKTFPYSFRMLLVQQVR